MVDLKTEFTISNIPTLWDWSKNNKQEYIVTVLCETFLKLLKWGSVLLGSTIFQQILGVFIK